MGTDLRRGAALLMLFVGHCLFGQSQPVIHSEVREAGYSSYRNLQLSEGGKWLTVRKSFQSASDTTLVFNTENNNRVWTRLVSLNAKQAFIGEKALLAQGAEVAEYLDLNTLRKQTYKQVRRAEVLSELKQFVILNADRRVSVYDENADLLTKVEQVEDYATDGKSVLMAVTKKEAVFSIVQISDRKSMTLYSSANTIEPVHHSKIGTYSVWKETEISTGKIRVIVVSTKTAKVCFPLQDRFLKADFIRLTALGNSGQWLIESEYRNAPEKDEIEIRYGNDPYLGYSTKGLVENQYWVWKAGNKNAEMLPPDLFSDYISINSERFLLALDKKEQFGYRFSKPLYAMQLYDRYTGKSEKIASASRVAVISARGRFIVLLNELTDQWQLFDTVAKTSEIFVAKMRRPVFSDDEKILLFETDSGLEIYDLVRKQWMKKVLPEKAVRINAKEETNVFEKQSTQITVSCEKSSEGMVIRALDKEENKTAFYRWNGKRLIEIMPYNSNFVVDFKTAGQDSNSIYTIEEFYNKSPELYVYRKGSDKKCLTCKGEAKPDLPFRREIISYRNAVGTNMKGMLLYPEGYTPEKKYPVVVRIYEEQSNESAEYLRIGGGAGFSARALLKNGYFVYLPDIIIDQRGSGISALDCVHSALDAIALNPSVDHTRIGLTGHSFGGYETNFIATHSTRFKAYISSGGIADLTMQYFTFNTYYDFTEYSRIENGQHRFKKSLAENRQTYLENNPILFADQVSAPILLWAGKKDDNILPSQTMAFYIALLKYKKDVIAVFYKNQGHVLPEGSKENKDALQRSLEWWNYFLKDKKETAWIQKQMIKDAR